MTNWTAGKMTAVGDVNGPERRSGDFVWIRSAVTSPDGIFICDNLNLSVEGHFRTPDLGRTMGLVGPI